jgi:ribosome-associated translation inhibitor RaiA
MRLQVRGIQVTIGGELRSAIGRRMRFVLGRAANHIVSVTVLLDGSLNSAGDDTKLCRITVRLTNSGVVSVADTGADVHATVNRVSERVGRSVHRELQRRRDQRRNPPLIVRATR